MDGNQVVRTIRKMDKEKCKNCMSDNYDTSGNFVKSNNADREDLRL